MYGLEVKYRQLNGQSLAKDLAAQICERSVQGKLAIVTDRPTSLLASVRKQWLRKVQKLHIERACTLPTRWTPEQAMRLVRAQSLTFTAKAPTDILEADVTFATVDDFIRYAPDCYMMS